MTTKTRAPKGTTLVRVHNPAPAFTLGMPGEKRKSNMAKTARKPNRSRSRRAASSRPRRRRRNTAAAAPTTAMVRYQAPARRSNPRRRRRSSTRARRRNPAVTRQRNPLGKIAGLSVMDLVGGAVGLVVDGVLQLVIPPSAGWIGIGIRGVGAVAMVKYAPKSIGAAAGLTMGAMVVKSAADKAFNLSGLVNTQVVRFLPAGNGANGQLAGIRNRGRVARFQPAY